MYFLSSFLHFPLTVNPAIILAHVCFGKQEGGAHCTFQTPVWVCEDKTYSQCTDTPLPEAHLLYIWPCAEWGVQLGGVGRSLACSLSSGASPVKESPAPSETPRAPHFMPVSVLCHQCLTPLRGESFFPFPAPFLTEKNSHTLWCLVWLLSFSTNQSPSTPPALPTSCFRFCTWTFGFNQ